MTRRCLRQVISITIIVLVFRCASAQSVSPDNVDAILAQVAAAADQNNPEEALRIATSALEQHSQSAELWAARAGIYEAQRLWKESLADHDRAIALKPNQWELWQRRGGARFKSGDVKGSIADFDKAISLNPALERRHWQRGLSYYYDHQFQAGAKQFELYQTYHASDVENVVWRFLCQAKVDGLDKARREMMPLDGVDQRVPMMEIDALYRGKSTPEKVLQAVEAASAADADPTAQKYREFYAHLYLGLYHEALGQGEAARHHIQKADKLQNDHYMWDVAHLHAQRLRQPDTKPPAN